MLSRETFRRHDRLRYGRLHSFLRYGRLHSFLRYGRLHSFLRYGRLHYARRVARCHLCSTLAEDPGKGPSPWKRAVIAGEQVLVCPGCQQRRPDWIEEAESCPSCGSKKLRKALGDRICGRCGHQWSDQDFSLD